MACDIFVYSRLQWGCRRTVIHELISQYEYSIQGEKVFSKDGNYLENMTEMPCAESIGLFLVTISKAKAGEGLGSAALLCVIFSFNQILFCRNVYFFLKLYIYCIYIFNIDMLKQNRQVYMDKMTEGGEPQLCLYITPSVPSNYICQRATHTRAGVSQYGEQGSCEKQGEDSERSFAQ